MSEPSDQNSDSEGASDAEPQSFETQSSQSVVDYPKSTALTIGVWLLLGVTALSYATENSAEARNAVWGWSEQLVATDGPSDSTEPEGAVRVEVVNRSLDVEITNRAGLGLSGGIPVEIVGPVDRCLGGSFGPNCVMVTVP